MIFFYLLKVVFLFFMRNDRLNREVSRRGERLTDTELIKRGKNAFILGMYHTAYTTGLILYVIERFG